MNLLQVITLLKEKFRLPNFTEEHNWTSSLRYYGSEHTEFSGDEKSDIEYDDNQGIFTKHLQNYFEQADDAVAPPWLNNFSTQGPWPKYFIEVKTTTSIDHARPFYVSGKQYDRVSFRYIAFQLK